MVTSHDPRPKGRHTIIKLLRNRIEEKLWKWQDTADPTQRADTKIAYKPFRNFVSLAIREKMVIMSTQNFMISENL